jgi:hypothetical protein
MKTRAAAAALVLLAVGPPDALAARTDVLVLRNGDRITGEIKKLVGGRLEFKTDKAGTIQVKWDAVARLTSTLFFEVILDDARRLYGELLPPTVEGALRVGTEALAVDVPLAEVAQIDRLRKTFWSRLKGSLDLGLTYTKADNKTEWNVKAQTNYRTPKRKLSLSAESIFRRADSGDFDRDDVTVGFQRFWGGRWLSATFGSLQRNSELSLDRRLLAGGAGGLHLLRTVENDLVAFAGLAFAGEVFTDERADDESLEALVGFDYSLYALGGREFTVTASFLLFPSLSVQGRVRFETALELRKELLKDFYFNVRFFDSFDNRAQDSGTSKNDFGVTTSVGWTF